MTAASSLAAFSLLSDLLERRGWLRASFNAAQTELSVICAAAYTPATSQLFWLPLASGRRPLAHARIALAWVEPTAKSVGLVPS